MKPAVKLYGVSVRVLLEQGLDAEVADRCAQALVEELVKRPELVETLPPPADSLAS